MSQILDRSPSGQENYRAVEGGSVKVEVNRIIPFQLLIQRFNAEWHLEETGKGYWIGYTDDMYSIAAYKDLAIKPLVEFINSSSLPRAKEAAIYTLHLIGIDSKIAGRFYEEFVNSKARKALLSLIEYDDLQEQVAELLSRDPWMSDMPILLRQMNKSKSNCWAIVNLITRYKISDLPIKHEIPEKVYDKTIPLLYNSNFDNYLIEMLKSIKLLKSSEIKVEESLFDEKLGGKVWYPISEANGRVAKGKLKVGTFITQATEVEYSYIGNKFQYYVEGSKVFICSSATSKARIINWWDSMSSAEKLKFNQDIPTRRFFKL